MLTRLYSLICDGCGRWSTQKGGFPTLKQARAYALHCGWARAPKRADSPGGDYCPRCKDGWRE